jgi:hypothetical protein
VLVAKPMWLCLPMAILVAQWAPKMAKIAISSPVLAFSPIELAFEATILPKAAFYSK